MSDKAATRGGGGYRGGNRGGNGGGNDSGRGRGGNRGGGGQQNNDSSRGGRGGRQAYPWFCPKGHPLRSEDDDDESGSEDSDDFDYECDVCKKGKNGDPAITCEDCEFDVCPKCVKNPPSKEKFLEILKAASPNKRAAGVGALPMLVFSAHGDTNFSDGSSSTVVVPSPQHGNNDFLYFSHCDNFAGVFAVLQAYFGGRLSGRRTNCQITYGEEGEINGVSFMGANEVGKQLTQTDLVFAVDVSSKDVIVPITAKDLFDGSDGTRRAPPPTVGEFSVEKTMHNKVLEAFLIAAFGEPMTIDAEPNPKYVAPTAAAAAAPVAAGGFMVPAAQRVIGDASVMPPPAGLFRWNMFHDCLDAQCSEDESDAYRDYTDYCAFIGLYTYSGDVEIPEDYHGGPLNQKAVEAAASRGDKKVVLKSNGDYNEGEVFCWKRDLDAVSSAVERLSVLFEAGVWDRLLKEHNVDPKVPAMSAGVAKVLAAIGAKEDKPLQPRGGGGKPKGRGAAAPPPPVVEAAPATEPVVPVEAVPSPAADPAPVVQKDEAAIDEKPADAAPAPAEEKPAEPAA